MRYCKLLLVIVVVYSDVFIGLADKNDVQVPLDTGYIYPVGEKDFDRRREDLNCAFWYSGLTHMRLVKILMENDGASHRNFGQMYSYTDILQVQLAIMFNLKTYRIGALWLIQLYLNTLSKYYKAMKTLHHMNAIAMKKIGKVNDYVVGKLNSDIADFCREGGVNRFKWKEEVFDYAVVARPYIVRQMMFENNKSIKNLLNKNKSNKLLSYDDPEDFRLRSLLIQNFGVNNILYTEFFALCDVNWVNTIRLLWDQWHKTADLDWASNNVQHFRSYYSMVFGVFKVIILRLMWEHLVYLRNAKLESRTRYAHIWLDILKEFSKLLCLHTDEHIVHLLLALRGDKVAQNDLFITDLIAYVYTALAKTSEPLGCVATNKFPFSQGEYNQKDSKDVDTAKETLSLEKATYFTFRLITDKIAVRNICVIWAFIDYLDELKYGRRDYKLF